MQILRFYLGVWGADWIHEQDVRIASGTADIQTGQLLIIKRCLCQTVFCTYKCLNIGIFHSTVVFYTIICNEPTKFLQVDSGLSLHATLSFSVCAVIWDKVTWLLANMTAVYCKTANCSVISTDWSHLWYSTSSCCVLRKCVILKCVVNGL